MKIKPFYKSITGFMAVIALSAVGIKSVSAGDTFRETGRFGVMGALTEDMWKGGFTYLSESWETSLIGHAGFDGDNKTTDAHIIAKAGYRHNLGSFNYLALGGEFGTHPGSKDKGTDVSGAWNAGAYVALERYFAGTNLMINLWVNPVSYTHELSNNGTGGVLTSNTLRFLQTGGFGIAYLF